MKNILICLEGLNIGGVETFVITQANELVKNGYNCYVMSKNGILRKNLNKKVKFIEYEFQLDNADKTIFLDEIKDILIKRKINLVYINQYPCVPYILPALLDLKIPFVTFNHSIVPGTSEWFMEHYKVFQILLPIYYSKSEINVCITKDVLDENILLFGESKDKYQILNNFIDLDEFKNEIDEKIECTNLLWVGRLCPEKEISIKGAVRFLNHLKQKGIKANLTVVGDGEYKSRLEQQYNNKEIKFVGATNDVKEYIRKSDIVLGVDRVCLEALAMNKPTIISSYEGNLIFINHDNISELSKENFSGKNQNDNFENYFNLDENKIKKIIEKNHQFIQKYLSSKKSIIIPTKKVQSELNLNRIIKATSMINFECEKMSNEAAVFYNKSEKLENELNKIKNSKMYKIYKIIYRKRDKR